jgi:hypothetical protein
MSIARCGHKVDRKPYQPQKHFFEGCSFDKFAAACRSFLLASFIGISLGAIVRCQLCDALENGGSVVVLVLRVGVGCPQCSTKVTARCYIPGGLIGMSQDAALSCHRHLVAWLLECRYSYGRLFGS